MKHTILGLLIATASTLLFAQEQIKTQADDIFQKLMEQDALSSEKNGQSNVGGQGQTKPDEIEQNSNQTKQVDTTLQEKPETALSPLQLQEMLRASIKQEIKIPSESQRLYTDKQLAGQIKSFFKAFFA